MQGYGGRMAYTIIDWIIDNADDKDLSLKKYSDFMTDIGSYAEGEKARGKPQLSAYLRKGDVLNDKSPKGQTILGEIDKNNLEWRDALISDINKVKDIDDLETIRTQNFEPNMGKYEDDTVNELRTLLATVRNTLREREAEMARAEEITAAINELRSQIEASETQDDLDRLPTMGEIRRRYGESVRREISGLIAERGSKIETLEERELRSVISSIRSADTIEALERVDISDVSERRLPDVEDAIRERRRELEVK